MAKKKTKKSSSKLSWVIPAVIIIGVAAIVAIKLHLTKPTPTVSSESTVSQKTMSFDFGNKKFMLDDQTLTFTSGSDVPNNATINNKSINPSGNRAAAILVNNTSGSGTFFYLIGAMATGGKEVYSKPVLLGDRIMIESVTVDDPGAYDNGAITVQYLDRAPNAPMSDQPTVQMTKKYSFEEDGNLIAVLH